LLTSFTRTIWYGICYGSNKPNTEQGRTHNTWHRTRNACTCRSLLI